ncbi:MAG: RteC domain-containing protein, partial [Patescibacteria group bacterium]|nr:RteC domain-containing protein [Patescibacteria group bacterium]
MPSLDNTFNNLLERYTQAIEKDMQTRLSKARDKMFTLKEIEKGEDFIVGILKAEKHKKDFIKTFDSHYKRGESIEYIFKLLRESYGEAEEIKPYRLIQIDEQDVEDEDIYISEEEKELKELSRNERNMLRFFVRYLAHSDIQKRLIKLKQEIAGQEPLGRSGVNYTIRWTGKKDNKNEFVQLIYALHQAKFINEGKGEITRIVETLAEAFNVQLGHNWQSNLSGSIHKRNRDYEPPIFKT